MHKRELYRRMGDRLREYRIQADMTQENAAELLDVSQAYYGRVERGLHALSVEKLYLAHERLGVDITYLISGDKTPEITCEEILKNCTSKNRYEIEQIIKYLDILAKKR